MSQRVNNTIILSDIIFYCKLYIRRYECQCPILLGRYVFEFQTNTKNVRFLKGPIAMVLSLFRCTNQIAVVVACLPNERCESFLELCSIHRRKFRTNILFGWKKNHKTLQCGFLRQVSVIILIAQGVRFKLSFQIIYNILTDIPTRSTDTMTV